MCDSMTKFDIFELINVKNMTTQTVKSSLVLYSAIKLMIRKTSLYSNLFLDFQPKTKQFTILIF